MIRDYELCSGHSSIYHMKLDFDVFKLVVASLYVGILQIIEFNLIALSV